MCPRCKAQNRETISKIAYRLEKQDKDADILSGDGGDLTAALR